MYGGAPLQQPFLGEPGRQENPTVYADAEGFLRHEVQSLTDAGCGDAPESAGESMDDEIRALSDLLGRKYRWLSVDEVEQVLLEKYPAQ